MGAGGFLVERYKVVGLINAAPAVDAVPVVRCRDCQEIEPCVAVNDWYAWCNAWGTVVRLDGFCHKGAKVDAKEVEA